MPISNNLAENTIRPFVTGRKNWLFSDTPRVVEANGLDPSAYLRCVLDQISFLGRSLTPSDLEAYLPWSNVMSKTIASYM